MLNYGTLYGADDRQTANGNTPAVLSGARGSRAVPGRRESESREIMARGAQRERILREAWIGDAVLCLYARRKILREDGVTDGPKEERMTSNQFLSAWAEPSEVEAEIGRIYEKEGLEAAFQWIEARLMPLFDRQEAKRARKETGKPAHLTDVRRK